MEITRIKYIFVDSMEFTNTCLETENLNFPNLSFDKLLLYSDLYVPSIRYLIFVLLVFAEKKGENSQSGVSCRTLEFSNNSFYQYNVNEIHIKKETTPFNLVGRGNAHVHADIQ